MIPIHRWKSLWPTVKRTEELRENVLAKVDLNPGSEKSCVDIACQLGAEDIAHSIVRSDPPGLAG
jgi:hypothetical protein